MAETNSEAKQKQDTETDDRKADVIHRRHPDEITDHQIEKQHVTFRSANNIELRITVHTPQIIQLKYVLEGDRPTDFSYAIDPEFNPDIPDFEVEESDNHFEIATASVTCRVSKKDMQVGFWDSNSSKLCSDKKPFFRKDTLMKGIQKVKITHEAPDDTQYFGLGDKITNNGLKGESFENWNTDSYGYEIGKNEDPLYRSIPFYAALNGDSNAYGIFMDNTYRSHFDFDSESNNATSFSAAGGCMNYYFIYGPNLTTVSERYTKLTGTPELPPMWGLGYHQCRWSYYPESRVRELADDFREKEIPCDALYLDIDYMDDYRVFTWNRDRFPNPKKLISDLKEQGFETIVMIDPGIKVDKDYSVYKEGLEKDYFCKRPDGELMIGPVWPPKTVFPDYTHPEVREWWADLYKDLISDKGVSGVWNDMNEPAVFEIKKKTFPEDIRHHYDGHPASHKKAHNIYGMQMARASYRGLKKHNKDKRPFLLTRANFSGGQRYAALWTGDNIANWEHLRLANEQCLRLSISGYSFVGTDIGGFIKQPSAELFSRWLQLGIFHPLFRNHTMGYNVDGAAAVKEDQVDQQKLQSDAKQEPWTFDEKHTEINRSVIELRYRLLYYLYTAFYKYITDGTPILRPLTYNDQTDPKNCKEKNAFLFGDHILVAPVLEKSKRKVKTYFPKGPWYDYRTNDHLKGNQTHTVEAPLADIPFFVKAGAVLPLREVMQYTRERDPELLELNVYYSESEQKSTLYEDAGEGYDYKKGDFRLTTFKLKANPEDKILSLTADRKGDHTPGYDTVKINIIGLPFEPSSISVDGKSKGFSQNDEPQTKVYTFTAEPNFQKLTVQ